MWKKADIRVGKASRCACAKFAIGAERNKQPGRQFLLPRSNGDVCTFKRRPPSPSTENIFVKRRWQLLFCFYFSRLRIVAVSQTLFGFPHRFAHWILITVLSLTHFSYLVFLFNCELITTLLPWIIYSSTLISKVCVIEHFISHYCYLFHWSNKIILNF